MAEPTIPSFYRKNGKWQSSGHLQSMTDTSLRVGRILAAYDIGEGANRNKRVPEYDVMVRHADGDGMVTDVLYPRVRMANLFGGATDFFRWTPRIDNFDQQTQVGYGSRVLLLCVNGSQRNAFIIGGIPHPEDGAVELPYNNNHHLEFQFNGMYANIDKDGNFLLLHRGATDQKDAVANTKGGNSSIQFNADGDITLGYNFDVPKAASGTTPAVTPNQDDLPYAKFLKQLNQIQFYAPSDIYSRSNARYLIETKDGIKVNHNGQDQQAWMLGTTYRNAESQLNSTIQQQLSTLMSTLTTMATEFGIAASALGTAGAAMLVPIAGPIVASPAVVATGVQIGLIATGITTCIQAVSQMTQAIAQFEQGTYLSSKHSHAENP
jgi:hypothetical protein